MSRMMGEYEELYGYDEEDSRNYEEFSESESIEDEIEELRGTIGRGDCIYCGAKHAMVYQGDICFVCNVCKKSVHEDIYYMWAAGYPVELEE